jgi:hypothetical protein
LEKRLSTVTHFAELIAGASLFIGPDSSGLHFAAAFETPALGLWGSFHPDLRVKYYKNQVHIYRNLGVNPSKNTCLQAALASSTLSSITKEEISAAVRELLATLFKAPSCGCSIDSEWRFSHADDLAAVELAANVCDRRIMEQEKVPMAEKIISLSDSDASFIVKGGWNTVVGYRPQLARSGRGFVTGLVLPRGYAADSLHLIAMVKEQMTNTGVIPSLTSADDGYSSQQGREEVLGLGVKVVSISGAKGKKLIEAQQWKSQHYRQARAERSAIESLVFTLKEGFEFAQMMRRTHENVLAEMLEKVLAYNISQIIRVRKKLSEPQEMERAAA